MAAKEGDKAAINHIYNNKKGDNQGYGREHAHEHQGHNHGFFQTEFQAYHRIGGQLAEEQANYCCNRSDN